MGRIKGWEKLKKLPKYAKEMVVVYKFDDGKQRIYAYIQKVFSKEQLKYYKQEYNVSVDQVKPSFMFIWGSLNISTLSEARDKLINYIRKHPKG